MFATDVNSLFVTDSFLGYATAVKARVVLKKPHPVFGFVNGKAAYGIRRVRSCRLCQMYISVGGGRCILCIRPYQISEEKTSTELILEAFGEQVGPQGVE